MKQQTLQASTNPEIVVEDLEGDLRVAGWDRSEVMARTKGEELEVESDENIFTITCDGDLILYLPREARLAIKNISGDVGLQAMMGEVKLENTSGDLTINSAKQLALGNVSGDATIRNSGGVELDEIQGDFRLQTGSGDCSVTLIEGDAFVTDIEGNVNLESVNGDLFLTSIKGSITAKTSSDAAMNLDPSPGMEYRVNADGDLLLKLPADVNAELHLATVDGDEGSLHIDLPGVELEEGSPTQDFILGDGSAKIFVIAGQDLIVTSKSEEWSSAADFGMDMSDFTGIPPIPPIPPLPPLPNISGDLNIKINKKVQKAMAKANKRTENMSRRASAKVEAAMRRAEARVRAAEVRARRGGVGGRVVVGDTEIFNFSSERKPASPKVSDDERLTILKMLQEKKISVEDAENLFASLEGKGE